MPSTDEVLARTIADEVKPLSGSTVDFDALIARVGDAECVLIGEAHTWHA